jgi:hypothetical protein
MDGPSSQPEWLEMVLGPGAPEITSEHCYAVLEPPGDRNRRCRAADREEADLHQGVREGVCRGLG